MELYRAPHPEPLPILWAAGSVALCVLGQALRTSVRGVVPLDTSSQGRHLAAGTLNTSGAYRFCRNPLYLGNLLIVSGLLALAFGPTRAPFAAGLGLSFFFFEYYFIIRAEEDFLETRFGDAYREYCRRVPRFWPRLTPAATSAAATPFDWARALRTEHNGAAAWIFGAIVIAGLRETAGQHPLSWGAAAPWLVCLLLLGASYLLTKGWKRGWWLRSG
jgi:protein-S-isoprenylcysteine O-methyltransferase Ste14